jgi:hypothetical protein
VELPVQTSPETPRGHDRLVVGVVSRCVVFSIIIKKLDQPNPQKAHQLSRPSGTLSRKGPGSPRSWLRKPPFRGFYYGAALAASSGIRSHLGKSQFGKRGLHASCPCPCGGRRGILVPSIHKAPKIWGLLFCLSFVRIELGIPIKVIT